MKLTSEFRQAALRNGIVAIPSTANKQSATLAQLHTAALEMANLGFQVHPDSLNGMSVDLLETMLADARVVIGADRNMKPVYPGFPTQVQELDTLTLIFEQILHYWTAGEFMPNYSDVERDGLPLKDMARASRKVEFRQGTGAAKKLISKLTQSSIALSDSDKELLGGAIDMASPTSEDLIPVLAVAKHGENMQTLVSLARERSLSKANVDDLIIDFAPLANNADQLLRFVLVLATEISGDENNYKHTKGYERAVYHLSDRDYRAVRFKSLSRPARRVVLNTLGVLTDGFDADQLVARRNLWQRVMRMFHPYTVTVDADRGVAVKRALDIIHENIEHRTFNSLVEEALVNKDVIKAVQLLVEHTPGNLLRRAVSLLRLVSVENEADVLADAIVEVGKKSKTSTLISAYNGVLSVNDTKAKLTRVAGLNNTLVSQDKDVEPVDEQYVEKILDAFRVALKSVLTDKGAPADNAVGVDNSNPVPLVRRDAATTDRVMDRGERLAPVGSGDTVRIFGHWRNNMERAGYMDCGAVVLDSEFKKLDTITWDSWHGGREWATYSGDKNVHPGDDAAEYIDVDLPALAKAYPGAAYVAMTIQSWSGFITKDVDMLAGVMLRSKPDSGEVFDPRSVVTAFKPTTEALQSVPLVVDVASGEMIWIDSSSGSTMLGRSAKDDDAVGVVVYDEVERPRLTMGELASLWADAHGVDVDDSKPVDRDAVLDLIDA